MELPALTFPEIDPQIRLSDAGHRILCGVRRKFVRLTPEEWVRQHVIAFLVVHRGYPASLLTVEQGFTYQGMPWRADVVAHDRTGRPRLLVECKAPEIRLRQEVFEQVGRYNLVVGAPLVVISNGLEHFSFRVDRESRIIEFLPDVPRFDAAP